MLKGRLKTKKGPDGPFNLSPGWSKTCKIILEAVVEDRSY